MMDLDLYLWRLNEETEPFLGKYSLGPSKVLGDFISTWAANSKRVCEEILKYLSSTMKLELSLGSSFFVKAHPLDGLN